MELLNRYRSVTALLLVIFAQLVLLAYQVKGNGDVRLIRIWAVTAITPAAKVVDTVRGGVTTIVRNYLLFKDLRGENERLKEQMAKLKLDNQQLRAELDNADRLRALTAFQARTPSKTVPARVIATGTGANSRVVFLDRGSRAGLKRGMAVITADGIVGKIIASYPTAAQVLLITDPTFAASVISQKHHVRGIVRGLGQANCRVDYIPNEQQVEVDEKFFTAGDDGVFPRGLPVGAVTAVRQGNSQYRDVMLAPSGLSGGLEGVLVITEGVHEAIPELKQASEETYIQPPPPDEVRPPESAAAGSANAAASGPAANAAAPAHFGTDADRLKEQYRRIGEAQGHTFGEGLPGEKPPNFNLTQQQIAAGEARAASGAKPPAAPAGNAAAQRPAGTPGAQAPAADSPQPQPARREPQ